ncbi:hypothetical protein EVAR_37379_1 [Eumeta japonica]|uniref:Uncharacterized protein n=1 Tax=Eumeta variegata TaxID=151549 RepID=A0A4C1ZTE5_EUMVA|nr:hypothetical protein EVAR_37379_1 [Eumeta japonica]
MRLAVSEFIVYGGFMENLLMACKYCAWIANQIRDPIRLRDTDLTRFDVHTRRLRKVAKMQTCSLNNLVVIDASGSFGRSYVLSVSIRNTFYDSKGHLLLRGSSSVSSVMSLRNVCVAESTAKGPSGDFFDATIQFSRLLSAAARRERRNDSIGIVVNENLRGPRARAQRVSHSVVISTS